MNCNKPNNTMNCNKPNNTMNCNKPNNTMNCNKSALAGIREIAKKRRIRTCVWILLLRLRPQVVVSAPFEEAFHPLLERNYVFPWPGIGSLTGENCELVLDEPALHSGVIRRIHPYGHLARPVARAGDLSDEFFADEQRPFNGTRVPLIVAHPRQFCRLYESHLSSSW